MTTPSTTTGTQTVPPSALLDIPLALLRESPLNYREQVDPTREAELEASLAAQGQLTPLLARPHYQADGGIAHYEIAAGASRLRAATRLGWPSLLVVVRPMDDRAFLEALVTENLQRTDPHPLDEAEAYARLEGLGYTVRDIAERVGMPPRYVARRLRLTALIPAARKAFLEGTLFVGHAEALARCTPAQQEKAVTMASDWRGPLPVRTLEERIAEAFHLPLAKAPFTMEDAELVPSAGSCVSCPKRSGAMPDLFADIKGENICTDGACYQGKVRALITHRLDRARQEGTPLVRLSDQHRWDQRPVREGAPIPANYWTVAKKSTPGAVQGIFVSGEKVGRTAWVTLDLPKPSVTKQTAPAKSDDWEARRRHFEAVELPARQAAREALLGAVRTAETADGAAAVIMTLLSEAVASAWSPRGEPEFYFPSAREACRLLGLPEPDQDGDGPPALPSLAHRPDFWTVTLTLPEVENGYVGADTPLLDRLCQRFAVDIAGIRAEREAVYRAAQAEKQAKSAKKAKPLAGDVRRAKAARS